MSHLQRKSKMLVAVPVIALCLGICQWASGQTVIRMWNGDNVNDSWHVDGNWIPSPQPDSDDDARIANGYSARISSDVTVPHIRVGYNGSGGIIQDSGTTQIVQTWIGVNGTNVGTYELNDGIFNVSDYIVVGQSNADNRFIQNGGIVNTLKLYVGNAYSANTKGYYDLYNGELNITHTTTYFKIANNGSQTNTVGIFTQYGGTVTSASRMQLGSVSGSAGEAAYNLLGGTITLEPASPFSFNNAGDNVYFNFAYGNPTNAALILDGVWNFASLTGIAAADFRVLDRPAGVGQLIFEAGVGELAGYTIVYAVPEPSACLLAGLACAALFWCYRRRPRRLTVLSRA